MKRNLIIAGVALGVLILGVLIYFLFFAGKDSGIVVGDPADFGTAGQYPGGEVPDVGVTLNNVGNEIAPRLVKVTDGPVAFGSVARFIQETTPGTAEVATTTRTDTELRYIERPSGNAYAYRADARTLTRLTNRTLPGVEEAIWTPSGEQVYVRFLVREEGSTESIETYALPTGNEVGYFLEAGLSSVVTNGQNVLTLKPSANGSVGTLASADGSNPRTLFSSVLSALRIYPAGTLYAAHTKASALLDGYGFLIGGTSGSFERILGPSRGLTLLPSPSGAKVLYGSVSGSRLETSLLDVATRDVIALPVGALPEKCVWTADETAVYCAVPRSLSGIIPDDWYQGAVSFSDRLWRINLNDRLATLVFDPALMANVEIDGVSLTIDPRSDFLFFTNRKDGSLWAYDL